MWTEPMPVFQVSQRFRVCDLREKKRKRKRLSRSPGLAPHRGSGLSTDTWKGSCQIQ